MLCLREINTEIRKTYVSSYLQPATVQILWSCFIETFLCLVQIRIPATLTTGSILM